VVLIHDIDERDIYAKNVSDCEYIKNAMSEDDVKVSAFSEVFISQFECPQTRNAVALCVIISKKKKSFMNAFITVFNSMK